MKWLRVGADGELEEVDGEQITRELREAERAAGPSPTSRDWYRCPFCYGRDGGIAIACRAVITIGAAFDWWSCPTCRSLFSHPRDLTLTAGLTRWEWSLVRHAGCSQAFGHTVCLPDVWMNAMEVTPDGYALEGPLGRLELGWRFQMGVPNHPRLPRV